MFISNKRFTYYRSFAYLDNGVRNHECLLEIGLVLY